MEPKSPDSAEQLPDPLQDLAGDSFGIDFIFPYQRLVITNILRAAGVEGFAPTPYFNPVTGEIDIADCISHQIVILPTGAGKSLCFMLPAKMLDGPTLVIFPLLSLMADQARRVREAGMVPAVLRGGQEKSERKAIWKRIENGEVDMVLTNPETALQPETFSLIQNGGFSHLVIDEMHTVSEWGETFRPVYLDIGKLSSETHIPIVTAFTATASEVIYEKVKKILFPGLSPNIVTANPDRPNISYRVIPSICKDYDLAGLLRRSPGGVKRPVIIFCRSRVGAEMTARILGRKLPGEEIFFYHAGLEKAEKAKIENWFYHSDKGILAATCAYGLGVDKKNIRTVIHRDLSPSIESYLQESGRGGRDREPAQAVLLYSPDDRILLNRMEGSVEKNRYEKLLEFAENNKTCRRETLLGLLGAVPEACFGCDVCASDYQEKAAGETVISTVISRNRRKFTAPELVQILAGGKSYKARIHTLWQNRFFGLLSTWEPEEIEEAIGVLISEGKIRKANRLIWNSALTTGRCRQPAQQL